VKRVALAAQRDLLALVLDTLVPASGEFPSAGVVALDHVLAVAARSLELESRLSRTLQAVEEAARVDGTGDFARRGVDGRESIVRRVEQSHPELFEVLVRHTYDGYYGHPTVIARLGLEPGPLHPRGHQVETAALPDLARVSARGPIYRQT
jgi:gluconate 2-dehydrogenase subunit 3-like protein